MHNQTDTPAEPGRVIGPETARPTEDQLNALAFEFWKARGCPEWLWGGLRGSRRAGADRGAMSHPDQGAKR